MLRKQAALNVWCVQVACAWRAGTLMQPVRRGLQLLVLAVWCRSGRHNMCQSHVADMRTGSVRLLHAAAVGRNNHSRPMRDARVCGQIGRPACAVVVGGGGRWVQRPLHVVAVRGGRGRLPAVASRRIPHAQLVLQLVAVLGGMVRPQMRAAVAGGSWRFSSRAAVDASCS